jgi:FixJ family two-component response regulator
MQREKNRELESVPTVYVVDDDQSVCRALRRLLKSAGHQVEIFNSAEAFLGATPAGPGCMVLDVRMPGLSGLELQEELSKADFTMPIIFITGHGDIAMGVEAMKRGAADFLPKPFNDDELLTAVESAIARDAAARTKYGQQQEIRSRVAALTPREYEVFTLVIQGLLNKQIAYELGISEKTVKVHRARVMEKMEVPSVAELVHLAEKVGIKPLDEVAPE